MHHKLKHFFIFLFTFVITFSVYTQPVFAETKDLIELLTKNKSLQDYGKEFCEKRSGELMNLETWYSGKCGENVDSLSGEGAFVYGTSCSQKFYQKNNS